MRIFALSMILLLVLSCSMNIDKMSKRLMKMDDDQQLTYLKTEVVNTPDPDAELLTIALKSIKEYKFYSRELCEYLRRDLFPDDRYSEHKALIFEIITDMNYPESSMFYWDLIVRDTPYKRGSIDALKKMGLKGFDAWKEQTLYPGLEETVNQVVEYDPTWVHAILDYYLSLPAARAINMNHILQDHEDMVLQDLVARIRNGEITQYESVQNIVELYDYRSLPHYDSLFELDDETVTAILTGIYRHYSDNGAINLNQHYKDNSNIDIKKRNIEMQRFLGSLPYRKNVEMYVANSQSDDEEKILIEALVSWYESIPEVFYPLLGRSDFFYNFKPYLSGYTEKHFYSINQAFRQTNIAGKVNLLEYCFESQDHDTLNKLLVNLDVELPASEEIESLWTFVILKAVRNGVNLHGLRPIVRSMLQSKSKQTLSTAALFIDAYYDDFERDLVEAVAPNDTGTEKWNALVDLFHHPDRDSVFCFLVGEIVKKHEDDIDISGAIAEVLINNTRFNYFNVCGNKIKDMPKWMPPLLISRIHIDRGDLQQYDQYFATDFTSFAKRDRIRIITYMKYGKSLALLRFFISNYEQLTAEEKLAVNASLVNFPGDEMVVNHICKLLLIGNLDDVDFIERFISVNDIGNTRIMDSLRKRYFRDYQWNKYAEIPSSSPDEISTLIDTIQVCYIDAHKYNQRYTDQERITHCFANRTLKMTGDSISIYAEKEINPLISCDKAKASKDLQRSIGLSHDMLIDYGKYLMGVADSSSYQRAFYVDLLRVKRETELNIGCEKLMPEENHKFLHLLIKVSNKGVTQIPLLANHFSIRSGEKLYEPSPFCTIYLQYIEKENSRFIDPLGVQYVNLIYEVDFADHDFVLEYQTRDALMIDTPIDFSD